MEFIDGMDFLKPIIIATTAPSPVPFDLPSTTHLHHYTAASTTTGNWAHLPTIVLYGLIKYLDTKTDIPRLRAVCSTWRFALPLSNLPQFGVAFEGVPQLPFNLNQPVLLRTSQIYLLSSPTNSKNKSWVVKVTQIGVNKWYLSNPLNLGRYILSSPRLTGKINLLDSRVLELSSPLTLVGGQHPLDFMSGKILSKKVVGGWNLRCGTSKKFSPFSALVLFEKKLGGGLLFLKLGDMKWSVINKDIDNVCESLDIVDIVYYKGEFYAFEVSTWHVGIIYPNVCGYDVPPWMEFFDAPVLAAAVLRNVVSINFVAGRDGLYVVFEVLLDLGLDMNKSKLMVFVLDEQELKWKQVRNIGDEVFFIGSDVAFAVSAELVPGWKAGTICLFNRGCNPCIENHVKELGDEMPVGAECMDAITYTKYWMLFRMFDMDDEEKGVVSFEDLDREVYTGLFFPPPPWVKWHAPSLDDIEVQLHNLKVTDAGGRGSCNVAAAGDDLLEEMP